MPLAGIAATNRRRSGSIGNIKPGRGAFNHFPEIAAAFPGALADIVEEVIDEVAQDAADHAPEAAMRRSSTDPEPGTLKDSWDVKVKTSKASGDTVSGRVTFTAKTPSGHRYPYYVEVGTATTKAQPFLVPAIMRGRATFNAAIAALESRLPK